VTVKWCADWFPFAERHPWGVKDPRLRALIERAIRSGDSSRAGVAALPGRLMLELRWLVRRVKEEIGAVRQPALIVHPREDDRASLRNLHYLQTSLGGLTETVVLDDSYHLVTLDRQRQIVVARTLEFAHRLHQGVLRTLADDAEDPMADARCEQRRES
jgi:carboxylesterase